MVEVEARPAKGFQSWSRSLFKMARYKWRRGSDTRAPASVEQGNTERGVFIEGVSAGGLKLHKVGEVWRKAARGDVVFGEVEARHFVQRHIDAPALLIIFVDVTQKVGQLHRVAQLRRIFKRARVAKTDDVRHHETDDGSRTPHIILQRGVVFIARLGEVLNHGAQKIFAETKRNLVARKRMSCDVQNRIVGAAAIVSAAPMAKPIVKLLFDDGALRWGISGRVIDDFIGHAKKRIKRVGRLAQVARQQLSGEIIAFSMLAMKRARMSVGTLQFGV